MRTREISIDQWESFFNDFTHLHQDEHVNVETIRQGDFGVQQKLCDLPLLGIVSAHPKSGQEQWIEVVARDASGAPATHAIAKPSRCASPRNTTTRSHSRSSRRTGRLR